MSAATVFRQVITALDETKIPYMLTGSFASNLYGKGRATQGIDLVIAATAEQLSALKNHLSESDYYFDLAAANEALRRRSMFNVLDMEHGWKFDFIFLKPGAYSQQAFSRRISAQVEGVPLIACTAEDLVIAKLDWARIGESTRQIEDVAGILKIRRDTLDLPYIEKWIAELGIASQWAEARRLAG